MAMYDTEGMQQANHCPVQVGSDVTDSKVKGTVQSIAKLDAWTPACTVTVLWEFGQISRMPASQLELILDTE